MKSLVWEEKGIRVDRRFLSNLRFADYFVLFPGSITEAEAMLAELNKAGKKVGLQINRTKTQIMKNAWADEAQIKIDGTPIQETSHYVYLGRSMNINNDMREELVRRQKAAWVAFEPLKEFTNRLTDPELRANQFDPTVLPTLCYGLDLGDQCIHVKGFEHKSQSARAMSFEVQSAHSISSQTPQLRYAENVRTSRSDGIHEKHKISVAGHIMRRDVERWTRRTVEAPVGSSRSKGRLAARWRGCACSSRETAATAAERLLTSSSSSNPESTKDDDRERQMRMACCWYSHMSEDEPFNYKFKYNFHVLHELA
nr:endonuclease-reverse transcriptase [Haemonchus contortus]